MSSNDNTVMTFVLGAAIGGLAALLLAPRSGEETRRRLRETADSLYEQGEEKVRTTTSEVRERAADVAENAKDRVQDTAESAQSRLQAVKEATDEAKDTYRKELRRQESRG